MNPAYAALGIVIGTAGAVINVLDFRAAPKGPGARWLRPLDALLCGLIATYYAVLWAGVMPFQFHGQVAPALLLTAAALIGAEPFARWGRRAPKMRGQR